MTLVLLLTAEVLEDITLVIKAWGRQPLLILACFLSVKIPI